MVTDRLTSFSQVVLRFYESAQRVPVQEFQDGALQVIREVIPFDASMWGSATMSDQGIDIHTLHLHNTSQQMIDEYQKVKHLDHFAHAVASTERGTIRFRAEDAQALVFREFLYRHKHLHGLITQSINLQTQFVQWLSLFRHNAESACSEDEVQLLDALFPHLMQALAINRKLHMEELVGDASRERWSVAMADHHGFLYHADPEFLRIISKDYVLSQSDRLPSAIMDAFAESSFELRGAESVLVGTLEKDLLFLKARPKVPADHLNSREFDIAKMLAGGLSNKEIALKLNRSPETVRSHGKSIYKKLGTSKATQLAGLLSQRE